MSGVTASPEPGAQEIQWKDRSALPISIFVYLIVWACTRAHFMADTNVYTQSILNHQHGGDSLDYRLLTANPFWDFGHILWRPLGWLCFVITRPLTRWYQSERGEVLLTLIGINFVAALACVFLFFRLAKRVCGANWTAVMVTFGLFSADAFLNYAHSGNAYVVGLACIVAGMDFSFGKSPHAFSALGAALMFALAVLFWFPYVFVLPGAIVAPVLVYGHDRRRLRLVGLTVVACLVTGLAVYASAIATLGIRTLADLKEWVFAAGHGHIQPGGLRAVARLAFSIPRSFINMDRDGMWLKRYLVRDPYAPVTARELFRLSLWKLVLFYASAAIICIELLRSRRGQMLFLILAATVLPVVVFALFIFEAGSIERYLPLYPFAFLACGYVFGAKHTTRASKLLLILALTATAAVNVNAMRRGTLESKKAEVLARIHDLIPLLGPNSLVLAVNEQDNLAQFRQNFPLDTINVHGEWRTYDMLEINTTRLSTWREDFAKRALATWQSDGAVWLPKRVFRSRPNPDWNWVEGDDTRVKWTNLPTFFSQLETGPMVGAEDGFVLLQNSPKNRQILVAISIGVSQKEASTLVNLTASVSSSSGRAASRPPATGLAVSANAAFAACVPPTYACARRDTSVIPLGALPNWGGSVGANTVFTDPSFNPVFPPQYARVTDIHSGTVGGLAYSGFSVGSGSGDDSHFNLDDTLFWITDSSTTPYFYGLNPTTMQTGLVWYGTGWPGAGAWSQVNANYFYSVGTAIAQTYRFDFTGLSLRHPGTPRSKLIIDYTANCGVNVGNGFTASAGIGGSDTVFGAAYGPQDYGEQVVAYNSSTNTCYFYNPHYGTIHSYTGKQTPTTGSVTCNGTTTVTGSFSAGGGGANWVGLNITIGATVSHVVAGSSSSLTLSARCLSGSTYRIEPGTLVGTVNTSDRFSVHDVRMDPSGTWMIVEEGDRCFSRRCVIVHAWQIGTTVVSNCVSSCGDHYTTTASGWINSYQKDGDPSPPPNPLLYRTWANFSSSNINNFTYFNNPSTSVAVYRDFDLHPSAKNDPLGTHSYPIFSSTYAPENPAGTITKWLSNEVVGWTQGTPGPVMRFGHTFNSAQESPLCCFTAEYAIGAVSSTGKFYLFTTDGEGTFGAGNGGTTCKVGTCRSDVFILNLVPPRAK